MNKNFPTVKLESSPVKAAQKLKAELEGFLEAVFNEDAKQEDVQAVTVLHSVETFIQLQFAGRSEELARQMNLLQQRYKQLGFYG